MRGVLAIETVGLNFTWFGNGGTSTVTSPIEPDLVRRAKSGDDGVWCHLYDQYYPFLFRYAFYRLRNREDAEDVASQVFLEAVRQIDRYEQRDKPLLAWLYGICRNLTAARCRQQGREKATNASLQVITPLEDNGAGLTDQFALEDALMKLTDDQREVVMLRFREGLSSREIAEVTGRRETAVYSLQVRGVARLRRLLTAA
jgi:RNA polymerase sigma-70 factor (ECF subfamily)